MAYLFAIGLGSVRQRIGGLPHLLVVFAPPVLALLLWPRLVLWSATKIGQELSGAVEAWKLVGKRYWSLLAMSLVNLVVAILLFAIHMLIVKLTSAATTLPLRLAAYLPMGILGSLTTVIMVAPSGEALLLLRPRSIDNAAAFD